MKKVLLVTLQDVNTGNRLQNYALQTVLKKLGYEVHTPYYTLLQYNSLKKQLKCTLKLALGITGMKRFSPDKFFYMRKSDLRISIKIILIICLKYPILQCLSRVGKDLILLSAEAIRCGTNGRTRKKN